jgi:hypothetical protein
MKNKPFLKDYTIDHDELCKLYENNKRDIGIKVDPKTEFFLLGRVLFLDTILFIKTYFIN